MLDSAALALVGPDAPAPRYASGLMQPTRINIDRSSRMAQIKHQPRTEPTHRPAAAADTAAAPG